MSPTRPCSGVEAVYDRGYCDRTSAHAFTVENATIR